ncbi:arylsulfatase A-like enzyme [Kribbella sp. VKM Ac-2569]|uniref:sulfatase family protein n=1 Tax=Kribbella sp. VKM Ac-2569 TaxID=2512220 RepID=UPI0010E70E6B|nr:sulfatase-like hydrolase/transferase [Kribbella sp. VKM Ac-2569]RZT27515.1 arylsulfatase A-like enzyme [Kribbella sp. VKM Ac-2569]
MNRRTPNILLVIADQHRFDWLEGTGDLPVRTPNIRRLQDAGVTFRRATTPSPLCAPARACLATGRDYDSTPVPNNFHDLPVDSDTYYRRLRDHAGYFVAGVGKFDLHKATFDWNLDGSRLLGEWGMTAGIDNEGKFDSLWSGREEPHGPYMKHLYDEGLAEAHLADFSRRAKSPYGDTSLSPLPEESYLDNWIAANAHALLDRRPADAPWHLVVNFAGPHDPMDVTERMRADWAEVDFPPPHGSTEFDGDHNEVRRRYAAMIENIDRHLGSFLDRLEREGELGNTVVIYTSDHGEMLGDHGIWGKQIALDPSIRIPLVISGSLVERPGAVSEALVSLEDLAATALEIAELETPADMTARSVLGVLRGDSDSHREYVVSGLDRSEREIEMAARHYGANQWVRLRGWRTVTTSEEKLIVSPDLDHPHLVDLAADPHEEHDLAAERPESVRRLLAVTAGERV